MWVFHLHVHLCIKSTQCLWRPEESSYPLRLELQTSVSHHVVLGAKPTSSARAVSA